MNRFLVAFIALSAVFCQAAVLNNAQANSNAQAQGQANAQPNNAQVRANTAANANAAANNNAAVAAVPVIAAVPATVANNIAAAVTNNANNSANANANAQANANLKYAVKIDNDFLLQLIALRNVAMSMNSSNVLEQLVMLHALWTSNDKLRTLFHSADFSAANIGLYYDPTSQKFALVDLSAGTQVDIQTFMARLQVAAAQNAAATPSGIIGSLPIVGPLLTGLPIVGPVLKGLGN